MKHILFEITNFKLDYDGVYKITSSDGSIYYACLRLDVILEMLEIEGLGNPDVYEILNSGYPLTFNKVILVASAIEYSEDEAMLVPYLTSELSANCGINKNLKMFEFTIHRDTL